MFWDSVVSGLGTLTHWEVYAAVAEYLVVFWVPISAIYLLGSAFNVKIITVAFTYVLVPLLQATATLIFVFTISPIALGLGSDAAWLFPWQLAADQPVSFLKAAAYLIVVSFVVALIPLIGRLQPVGLLVTSGFALVLLIGIFDASTNQNIAASVDFVPDLFFIIGILVVGFVVSMLSLLVISVFSLVTTGEEGLGTMLALPIGAAFGFIPFFIYAAWVGLQMPQ